MASGSTTKPLAIAISGASSSDDARLGVKMSLNDPTYELYSYWSTLDVEEQDSLLDRAMNRAMKLYKPGDESADSSRPTLESLLLSNVKELIKQKALDVPQSANTSPSTSFRSIITASGSASSIGSRFLKKKGSLASASGLSFTEVDADSRRARNRSGDTGSIGSYHSQSPKSPHASTSTLAASA